MLALNEVVLWKCGALEYRQRLYLYWGMLQPAQGGCVGGVLEDSCGEGDGDWGHRRPLPVLQTLSHPRCVLLERGDPSATSGSHPRVFSQLQPSVRVRDGGFGGGPAWEGAFVPAGAAPSRCPGPARLEGLVRMNCTFGVLTLMFSAKEFILFFTSLSRLHAQCGAQ